MPSDEITLSDLLRPLVRDWRITLGGTLLAAGLGVAGSFLIPPTFTSTATLIPPQQRSGGGALAALAALGDLGSLATGGGGAKNPADQFVSLLQSVQVSDRIIDKFKLMQVYGEEYRQDTRKALDKAVSISVGKKDGIISIVVDDESPARAAEMANQYVAELRRIASTMELSEAQQRRAFFEKQLKDTKERLIAAQAELQVSGFNATALKAEPKAAAEGYAAIKAQLTASEVELRAARSALTDSAPEVQRLVVTVAELKRQLAVVEHNESASGNSADYLTKFREFKYQQTLFELMARQYEMARVDEAQDGSTIQVIDVATPAEKKSKPRRGLIAAFSALLGFAVVSGVLISRDKKHRL